VPPGRQSIEDLGGAHPAINKAYNLAKSFPQNQEPVEALRELEVFKFPLGAYRAATWLDPATNVVWLLGYGLRRGGEAYSRFEALHQAGELLPGRRDELRDAAEAEIRFLRAAAVEIPDLIERAGSTPGQEVAGLLGGWHEVGVYLDDSGDMLELWVAVSTMQRGGNRIADELVLAVFVMFEQAVGAQLSDEVTDPNSWPGARSLAWFEVARLYVA
jgi:hypothetical protein